MTEKSVHKPVLLQEVLEILDPKEGDVVLDGTLGGGGHARKITSRIGKAGVYIGLDQDADALLRAKATLSTTSPKIHFILENFRNIDDVLVELDEERVDKILLDLGLSSDQLEQSGRGFAFRKDEPLLMTMRKSSGNALTAREIVNYFDEDTIRVLLENYGSEHRARKIARAIVALREEKAIETTIELRELIEKVIRRAPREKIHPATKTFQALRMAVNDEYQALEEGLRKGWDALTPGGRMVVISFHSLEDRLVKNFFREKKTLGEGKILTKKPVVPDESEIKDNPRSRSAKLRGIEKI